MSCSFHKPAFDDIKWMKEKLKESQPKCCDFSSGNLIGWSRFFNGRVGEIDDCLVVRVKDEASFCFPKGKNYEQALKTIVSEYGYPDFYTLEKHETEIIEKLFPGKYSFKAVRNSFDYVYSREKLATLKGKKYHAKRNHISYFEKNNNWSFEPLSRKNIADCVAMNEKWYELNVEKDRVGIEHEREVLRMNFEHFEEIGCVGGVLRVDGDVVAFTFGERLNDNTFDTHFEKAFSDIRGAYPMINMLFAKNMLTDYELVNREDDVGSEGLRSAKLSYHPEILMEKYAAINIKDKP